MKAIFNLKEFLTANKEVVLADFEKLTKKEFYNGISLKDFMIQVMQLMQNNNPKSEKRATSLLPFLSSNVLVENSKIFILNDLDEKKRSQYMGTAYMAII